MSAHSPTAAHAHTAHEHHELGFVRTYIFSTDHKMIARQFLFLGLFMMIIGGLLALVVRWQLAWPETPVPGLGSILTETGGILEPQQYNMAFTMHATIMIFFVIMPILAGAFGNFCIPLMIGARDMAFPKLNMLSYWVTATAGLIMLYISGGMTPSVSGRNGRNPGTGVSGHASCHRRRSASTPPMTIMNRPRKRNCRAIIL